MKIDKKRNELALDMIAKDARILPETGGMHDAYRVRREQRYRDEVRWLFGPSPNLREILLPYADDRGCWS